MLISYTTHNYKSFKEKASLNMLPLDIRAEDKLLPTDRLIKTGASQCKTVLPIAAIYGDNGSGKSNLISGLKEFIECVASGRFLCGVCLPFYNDATGWDNRTTAHSMEFTVGGSVFELQLEVKDWRIVFEKLTLIDSKGFDVLLYERVFNDIGKIYKPYHCKAGVFDKAIRRCQNGQLFISVLESFNREVPTVDQFPYISDILKWFRASVMTEDDMPLTMYRDHSPGKLYIYDSGIEAGGPGFDSLHYLRKKSLILDHLSKASKEKAQLVIATQDLIFFDNGICLPEELWIVDHRKDNIDDLFASSHLYSVSEYKEAVKDPSLRDSYLQGRFGGIPEGSRVQCDKF